VGTRDANLLRRKVCPPDLRCFSRVRDLDMLLPTTNGGRTMRSRLHTPVALLLVLALSIACAGESIRITAGSTVNYMLLQPTPNVYRTVTYWGGVGVDVLFRSLMLSVQATVTDFETLRITSNPAFYFTAAVPYFRSGSLAAFIEGGVIIDPFAYDPAWIAPTIATGFTWSPLSYTTVRLHIGYETVVLGSRYGSGIYVGMNVSVYFPVL